MKNYLTISIYFILIHLNLFGQKTTPSIPPILDTLVTNFQWMVFITQDTTYNCTKFIKQDGRFEFSREFADTSYFLDLEQNLYTSVTKKEKRKGKLSRYLLRNHFISKIDTLYSYYKHDIIYPDSGKWVSLLSGGIGFEDMLLEDIEISYILQRLAVQISDSSIYLLYPNRDLNFSYQYTLLGLNRSSENGYNLFIYKAETKDFSGMQITNKDSAFIPNKKLKRFNKSIAGLKMENSNQCLRPGIPWLLLYKNKKFIISNYCIWEERKRDKSLKTMFSVYSSFRSLKLRYFKSHSSSHPRLRRNAIRIY